MARFQSKRVLIPRCLHRRDADATGPGSQSTSTSDDTFARTRRGAAGARQPSTKFATEGMDVSWDMSVRRSRRAGGPHPDR
jgi:hypothetical protein